MNRTRSNLVLVTTALGLTLPLSASAAQGFGFYIGAFGGYSEMDLSDSKLNSTALSELGLTGANLTSTDTRKSGTPYGVTFGFQPIRFLAIEAAYIDLGKAKGTAEGTVPGALSLTTEVRSRGATLDLIGILPLGHFSIDGRAGVYYGETKATFTGTVNGTSRNASTSKSAGSLTAGVGIAYIFDKHWSMRLDYQYFDQLGDGSTAGPVASHAATLGARFHFL